MGTLDSYAGDFSRIEGRFAGQVKGKSAIITGSNTGAPESAWQWQHSTGHRYPSVDMLYRTSAMWHGMCQKVYCELSHRLYTP